MHRPTPRISTIEIQRSFHKMKKSLSRRKSNIYQTNQMFSPAGSLTIVSVSRVGDGRRHDSQKLTTEILHSKRAQRQGDVKAHTLKLISLQECMNRSSFKRPTWLIITSSSNSITKRTISILRNKTLVPCFRIKWQPDDELQLNLAFSGQIL